jgi:hypothetical protein
MNLAEAFTPADAAAINRCAGACRAYNGELGSVLIGIRQTIAAAGADPSAGSAASGSQDTGANRNLGLFSVGAGLAGVRFTDHFPAGYEGDAGSNRFPDTPSGGVGAEGGNKFPDTPSGGIGAPGGNKFPDTPSGGIGAPGGNKFPDTPSGGAGPEGGNDFSGSFAAIPITGGG